MAATFMLVLSLSNGLSACSGSLSLLSRAPNPPPPPPPGATETIEPNGEVIVQPAPPPAPDLAAWCFARARHFQGVVARQCADIARETRP
jgi:hypothetical protein